MRPMHSLPLWSLGMLTPLPALRWTVDKETSCYVRQGGTQTTRLGLGSKNTPFSVLYLPKLCQPRPYQPHLPW